MNTTATKVSRKQAVRTLRSWVARDAALKRMAPLAHERVTADSTPTLQDTLMAAHVLQGSTYRVAQWRVFELMGVSREDSVWDGNGLVQTEAMSAHYGERMERPSTYIRTLVLLAAALTDMRQRQVQVKAEGDEGLAGYYGHKARCLTRFLGCYAGSMAVRLDDLGALEEVLA